MELDSKKLLKEKIKYENKQKNQFIEICKSNISINNIQLI
jgi:hypothetical protein